MMLNKMWVIGYRDRGMGHYTYGIIVKDSEEVIIPSIDYELADHIVGLHNASLEKSDEQ